MVKYDTAKLNATPVGGMNIGNVILEFDYNIVSHVYGRRAGALEESSCERNAGDQPGMNTWSGVFHYFNNSMLFA